MNRQYLIGIDGGTQSTKVVIFDLDGRIICRSSQKLKPMLMSRPGVAEHPDDDLWDSVVNASRNALAQFEGNLDSILAIGLCTIRCCRALLNKNGSLTSPVLNWMDIRLSRPYEHTDPNVQYITTSSGYITHRFTGRFRDTAANYEGKWPIDKDTWQWSEDPEVVADFNIPRENLFELTMPGSILGNVTFEASRQTGIPEGIPVVATANDKAVEALGAGLIPGKTGLVSLGTFIAGMVYGDRNIKDAKHFFANMASIPGHYLYESRGIRQGMWTVSWFRNLFGEEIVKQAARQGTTPEEILNLEAEKVPAGSNGLMTVPEWLAPPDKPFKKGVMVGFHAGHSRGHIHRSILEAIALTMKNNFDCMCNELGLELDSLIVSGGGSSGDLFMQIFADVFGIPTIRNVVNGAAVLGAAICAAVAVGAYESFETAVNKMVMVRDRFKPIDTHTSIYNKMNTEVYKTITAFTDPIFKKSYPIFSR